MLELSIEERMILTKLNIPKEEVCIWSCIEGKMGRAWIDDKSNPQFGLVAVADFLFLLGDVPDQTTKELKELIETYGKNQIIVFENPAWEALILNEYPETCKAFKRYEFYWEPDQFDIPRLQHYAQAESAPYKMEPFNLNTAEMAGQSNFTADFCMFFESPEIFLKQGIGFCFVHENQIIAGASSYSACKGAIDITIGTIEAYRRKGLALKCAAKLILTCLERGIYPRWDAANLESVDLARKLGYRLKGEYQVYTIR